MKNVVMFATVHQYQILGNNLNLRAGETSGLSKIEIQCAHRAGGVVGTTGAIICCDICRKIGSSKCSEHPSLAAAMLHRALTVATASKCGAVRILSEDLPQQTIAGVRIENPFTQ
jgi:hypothetical protein